jgi:hypothetical protein
MTKRLESEAEALSTATPPKVAAVTMVYNEPIFLPLWRSHYGGEFGEQCCYVVDHGSDDGSTDQLGKTNVLRIPRSPKHNKKRAQFISEFCSSLLEWYDTVIYTDVDEFVVADPLRWNGLTEFAQYLTGPSVNCIGFDVYQVARLEGPLDPELPVLQQRHWARFSLAMCKPLMVRSRVSWQPGFHSSDHLMTFGDLVLFHLHYFDQDVALARQAKTRSMPWGDGPADHYQRWPDEKMVGMMSAASRLERIYDCTFGHDDKYLRDSLDAALALQAGDKRHQFYFGQIQVPNRLYRIPVRFENSLPGFGAVGSGTGDR